MIEGPPGVGAGCLRSPRGLRPTLGPIGNLYREFASIAYGFFSPSEGFMPWNEVESVLREGRLLSGWFFPSSDAERAPCGHGVFMERALFVAGAGGCGRRDWRREAWDFVDEAFLEGREALGLGGYFAGVSFVLWGMRHGIPLGGCSYGRYASHVWAWPRGFLDPYAVHVLWTRGLLTRSGLRAVLLGVCLLSQVRRVRGHGWRGSFLRGRVFGRLLWLCVLAVKWRRVYGRSVRYLI